MANPIDNKIVLNLQLSEELAIAKKELLILNEEKAKRVAESANHSRNKPG